MFHHEDGDGVDRGSRRRARACFRRPSSFQRLAVLCWARSGRLPWRRDGRDTMATAGTVVGTAAKTTAVARTPLLRHRVRHRVVRLLERLQVQLGLVLARYVPSHGVVARERPLAERARYPDTLVALPYVGAQVCLVAVQLLAVRALQFLAVGGGDSASLLHFRIPHSGISGCRAEIRSRWMSKRQTHHGGSNLSSGLHVIRIRTVMPTIEPPSPGIYFA